MCIRDRDISDPILPTFSLTNEKTHTVTLTGTYTTESTEDESSNSFTGTTTGIFKSDLIAADSGKNTFNISASSLDSQNQEELLFFHAKEDPDVAHTRIDGESFIWRVLPANKNISIWDPDNRLLIDTNYDGKYESGVKSFTGAEIHFKINPSPSGETPYEFFASQCRSCLLYTSDAADE